MRLIFSFIFTILLVSTGAAQSQYSKVVEEQIKKIENGLYSGPIIDNKTANILDRMKHYNVNGISIAVIDNNKIVWAKGYGYADRNENRKVDINTKFEPGSISKSLNAVGVLFLAQQKKLNLYKDINEYLTTWKFPYDTVAHQKKITTAQLLSHTAGVSVYGFPGYNRDSTLPTITDILNGKYPSNTPAVRSLIQPGIESSYSGGGILISQQILTNITGQSYEQYMHNSVFRRLAMNNSFYNQPPASRQQHNLATGYEEDGKEVPGKYFVFPEKAAAGLWTTPTDLCKYIIEMQLAYKGKSSRVLNQKMAKLHLTPYKNETTAMGTFLQDRNGEKYFFHDAGNIGFRGFYIAGLTNSKGVVLFVNSDNGDILLELLNSVALVYDWKGFAKPEHLTTVPISEKLSSEYAGEYITDGQFSELKNSKDGLYMWIGGINSKMYFTSEIDFRNIEFPTKKSFVRNTSGHITGFTRSLNGEMLSSAQQIENIDTLKPSKGQLGIFGRHLLEGKEFDKALKFLSRGVTYEPEDSSIQKNMAHCYLFKNDFEQAIQLYQQFLNSSPQKEALQKDLNNDFEFLSAADFSKVLIKNAKEQLAL